MSWNNKLENSIRNIEKKSHTLAILYIESSKTLQFNYNTLSFISICLGPLSSTLTSISIALNNPSNFFSVASIIIGLFSGILVTLIKFSNFEDNIEKCRSTSNEYSNLKYNIERQLSLDISDRIDGSKYFSFLNHKIEEINKKSPLLVIDKLNKLLVFELEEMRNGVPQRSAPQSGSDSLSETDSTKVVEQRCSTAIDIDTNMLDFELKRFNEKA